MKHTFFAALLLCAGKLFAASAPLAPPSAAALDEARTLIDTMKRSDRGPYSQIRWFCKDGSVHPPKPYACGERGGGRQHAEYSKQRQRLGELGWHVGTIVAALSWDEIWQPAHRHQRLRELPLERFLEAVDDGWVLRKARHYRGRAQLEDEESNGRALLLRLLAQPGFLDTNFLLARELARNIPHGADDGDRTRTIRHLAQEIAEIDSGFTALRIEVHSRPSAATAAHVREWLASKSSNGGALGERAQRLAGGLDELYGLSGRKLRLQRAAAALSRHSPEATRLIGEAQSAEAARRIEHLSRAMAQLRSDASAASPGASLLRLDLLTELDAELRTSALEFLAAQRTRAELLTLSRDLLRAAWGLGLLSRGEHEALSAPVDQLLAGADADGPGYAFATRRLSLAAAWAAQGVQHTFAEALLRYGALEPKAARFVDDLLRDTVLLPLGEAAHQLAVDGAAAAGVSHRLFGEQASGLLGINPGVARGRLRVLEADQLASGVQAEENEIVVLTETVADLNPVAGILTMGEGNPLSHVQMLARNLGIPNVAVAPALLARLRKHAGEEVRLAVAGDGRVLLEPAPAPGAQPKAPTGTTRTVSAPRPELGMRRPLPLAELDASMSGKVVGPKAANVGELNRRFPGRVAPAIALPFGIFAEHTTAARERLAQAFRRHRDGALDQAGLESELDAVREAVAALSLRPALASELSRMMADTFGPAGSYGVFVRSDTNAEDLPEFTGAGLNLTLPNVVGLERQLAGVIQVWASAYTRRAMSWRARILSNPEEIYSSVLLMKSVPSEKSGVMVTADLVGGGAGQTVSVAWGVGGAVDNESAASSVLRPDGSALLLAEAKAPYQRILAGAGGVGWKAAPSGPILDAAEMDALRALAREVVDRYPPAVDSAGKALPWDIEFAFAGGKLWLLQIRPLVQRGRAEADAVVNARIPSARSRERVALNEIPQGVVAK